jgi:hypothetical protein
MPKGARMIMLRCEWCGVSFCNNILAQSGLRMIYEMLGLRIFVNTLRNVQFYFVLLFI